MHLTPLQKVPAAAGLRRAMRSTHARVARSRGAPRAVIICRGTKGSAARGRVIIGLGAVSATGGLATGAGSGSVRGSDFGRGRGGGTASAGRPSNGAALGSRVTPLEAAR